MDTIALVGNQIDEGGRLIEALTRGGLSVNAAVWVRPAEDDRWALYLVSDEVDTKGPLVAYRAAAEALREIPGTSLTMSEIKLVGTEDAQARSLLDVLRGSSGATPARMRRSSGRHRC